MLPIQSYTVDVSGGGFLLAGPDMLRIGDQLQLPADAHAGRCCRSPAPARSCASTRSGRRAVAFDDDHRRRSPRLIRFIFECQRAELRRGLEQGGSAWRLRRRDRRGARRQPPPAPRGPEPAKAERRSPSKAQGEGQGGEGQEGREGGKDAKAADGGRRRAASPLTRGRSRGVARAKSWGALAGFVLGGYLSLPTNTLAEPALRALMAGIVCYVAVWAGAVFLWRRLVILELKGREQQLAPRSRRRPARAAGGPPGSSVTRSGRCAGAEGRRWTRSTRSRPVRRRSPRRPRRCSALERVARERDRPAREQQQRQRREPTAEERARGRGRRRREHPHIDVRV